jgi:hypothetical protein
MKKETFWKVVDPDGEFPGGMIFEGREDALWFSNECRDNGGVGVYTRKIKMSREDYENITEE